MSTGDPGINKQPLGVYKLEYEGSIPLKDLKYWIPSDEEIKVMQEQMAEEMNRRYPRGTRKDIDSLKDDLKDMDTSLSWKLDIAYADHDLEEAAEIRGKREILELVQKRLGDIV